MADRMLTFLQKLYDRTREGKVGWERTADEGVYQAAFPGYTVRLSSRPGQDNLPDFVVQILDQDGSVIEETTDVDLQTTDLGVPGAYQFMERLYKAVRRKAMGIDSALNAIMESLDKDLDPDVPF